MKKQSKKQKVKITKIEPEEKIPRMRTVRLQHSEIWDWGGTRLNPAIREQFQVGNVLRILVISDQIYPAGYKWYFRIVKICNKDRGCFVGVKQDPYWSEDRPGFRNGQKIVFSKKDVFEVPLDWQENLNLKKKCRYRYEETHKKPKFTRSNPFGRVCL